MDQAKARALLADERARLQRLLQGETGQPQAAELGDEVDDADRRNAEETGMAVDQLLRARWAALQRAEARLVAGGYGRSVHSGQPIPDERLEADPLAELTVQEAAAAEREALEVGHDAVGLVSASHPFEVLADADITPEEAQAAEEDDDDLPQSRSWASTSSVTTGPGSRVHRGSWDGHHSACCSFRARRADRVGIQPPDSAERRSIGPANLSLLAQLVILADAPM